MSQTKKNFLLAFILISALCPSSTEAFAPTKSFQSINKNHLQSKVQVRDYQIQNAFHNTNQPFNLVTTSTNNENAPRTKIAMNMMAPAATTGAAAVMGVISGGLLGGALHAIAGKHKLEKIISNKAPHHHHHHHHGRRRKEESSIFSLFWMVG